MLTYPFNFGIWVSIALAGLSHAHITAFHEAMYCKNGTDPSVVNLNTNDACNPLYNLPYSDYWFHHVDGCDQFPPEEGVFLELNAGGSFTVELATNRACTSLNNPNPHLTDWGDCLTHPDDYSMTNLGGLPPTDSNCLPSPNLHAQNQSMTAGTSFAIAYKSEISEVTLEDLVVFTVRYHTPWKRVTTYDVPSGMPPCPDAGCICSYNWIPNGCGQPNMYMNGYRCKVIPDSTSPKTIGTPKPPVWCEDDPSKCVQGPKQIMIWNQLEGNTIEVEGYDLSGGHKSPAYNAKCGFNDGAQNDIFVDGTSGTNALAVNTATGSGTSALPSSAPTSSLPAGSGTPTFPVSDPASGTPTFPPSSPPPSGTPTDPASDPASGTPSFPASAPPPSQPAGSGTPTGTPGTCTRSAQDTTVSGHAAHAKRMVMRREKHGIF